MKPSDPYEATPAVISDRANPDQERRSVVPPPIRFSAVVSSTLRLWWRGWKVALLVHVIALSACEAINCLPLWVGDRAFTVQLQNPWIWIWFAFEYLFWAFATTANVAYLGRLSDAGGAPAGWRDALGFRWRHVLGFYALDVFLMSILVAAFALVAASLNVRWMLAAIGIFFSVGVVVYLWSSWAAARPLMVVEKQPVLRSLGISHKLAAGHRMPLAAVTVFFVAIYYVLQLLPIVLEDYVPAFGGIAAEVHLFAGVMARIVFNAVAATLIAAFYVTIYRALRAVKPDASI